MPEETTLPTSTKDRQDAIDAGRTLLEDAQEALDEAFGDLDWSEASPASTASHEGGCRWTSPTLRCDRYLGEAPEDHQRIADALTTALSAHGLPPAPPPTGGTGGWLTTSSAGGGTTLRFRSKGYAELAVTVDTAGDCSPLEVG